MKKMETILANLPMALCLLLGMGLIIVEVFLPGFGLPGVAGIALVGVGTIMAAMHFGTLTAVALLLVIIAVLAVLISWLLRSAAKGDMGKSKLFLHQKDELCDQQQDMQVFVGHEGKTLSVLRPSGIGDFDGVRLNVVTEGEFIENGTPIRIVRVEGGKIVVKAMYITRTKELEETKMVAESIILLVAIILAVLVFLRFIPLNLWISALASGVHVSIFTLMGMRIRRVPPAKIVGPLIKAEKAGLNMQISKMEAHFLAGGNLDRVITALITARGANIKLDFPEACAIDLAGRDVLQAVQMSVNPKVIETPVVAAIAKDGIELRAKARVTARVRRRSSRVSARAS